MHTNMYIYKTTNEIHTFKILMKFFFFWINKKKNNILAQIRPAAISLVITSQDLLNIFNTLVYYTKNSRPILFEKQIKYKFLYTKIAKGQNSHCN